MTQTGPLDGLKVVEFGLAMAGPYCAMMLADYGADVVKVERIGTGDDSRSWSPFYHAGLSHYFAAANRNKRSIALDIKTPGGIEVMRRLAAQADIIVDNFRVGALDAAGLDYATLARTNPRVIYCSISGFGRSGPRAGERANDVFMQAFTGGMSITGETDGGPAKMGMSVADVGAGLMGTIAILMALETRHRTGRGQLVETSLFEGQLSMLANQVTQYLATGINPVRRGSAGQVGVPYQAFPTADDWLVIAAFNPRMWAGVCKVLGKPEWEKDPRIATAHLRSRNRDFIVPAIAEILRTRPAAHWKALLDEEGVPCTPVNEISTVVGDVQTAAREMVVTVPEPDLGSIRLVGVPIKMSDNQGSVRSPPPRLGEHTADILQELGYAPADIVALAARGCVGGVEPTSGGTHA